MICPRRWGRASTCGNKAFVGVGLADASRPASLPASARRRRAAEGLPGQKKNT